MIGTIDYSPGASKSTATNKLIKRFFAIIAALPQDKEKTTPPPERRPKSLSKFILYSRGHGGLDVVRIRDVAGERQLLHAELGVDGLRVLLQEIHTAGQGRNGQNEEKSLLSYPETMILLLFGFNN